MKSKRQFGLLLCAMLVWTTSVKAVSEPMGDSGWAMTMREDLVKNGEQGGQVAWPYVYGIVDDAVIIELDKLFNRPFAQDGFNYPIIIEFEKLSVDATEKIIIRDEYIVNETGSEWVDYHMFLIVNSQDPQAGFDPSYIPDGDQFEDVSFTSNIGYNGLPIQLNFVDTDGEGVPSSGENVFQPAFYTESQIVIITDPEMEVGEHFGLKEIPTIPEPATLLLLGIGGLITIMRKGKST